MPDQTTLSQRLHDVEEEARRQEQEQRHWVAEADDLHHEIRQSVQRVGRKIVTSDLGIDQSTLSNWLACEVGRGFPPPRLILYLLFKDHAFAVALMTRAKYLPPEKPHVMPLDEQHRRVLAALASNADVEKLVLDRAFGPGVRP